jgi:hypothetical protein
MQVIHKSASLINPTFDRTPASMITGNILYCIVLAARTDTSWSHCPIMCCTASSDLVGL